MLEVKRHSCRETGQSGDSPIVPSKDPKPQSRTNVHTENFFSFCSLFETTTHENEQQDSVNVEIKAEIKVFFC